MLTHLKLSFIGSHWMALWQIWTWTGTRTLVIHSSGLCLSTQSMLSWVSSCRLPWWSCSAAWTKAARTSGLASKLTRQSVKLFRHTLTLMLVPYILCISSMLLLWTPFTLASCTVLPYLWCSLLALSLSSISTLLRNFVLPTGIKSPPCMALDLMLLLSN